MKLSFLFTLLIGAITFQVTLAQTPERESLEIMNKYLQVGMQPTSVDPCQAERLSNRLSLVNDEACNEDIRKTFRSTQRFSVYSLFHNERPFNQCTKDLVLTSEELESVKKSFSERSGRDGLYQHFAFQCQEALGTDDDDYHFQSAMLQAAHNLRQKQLESIALQSMRGLNNLDNILGREIVEKEIHCNANISQLVKESCETFTSCPKRRGRVAFQAKMTHDTLETSLQLDDLIDKTERKIRSMRNRRAGPGPQPNQEQVEQLRIVLEDLKANQQDILSTIPWIQGKEFQKDLKKLKRRIKNNAENEEDPSLRDARKRSLISDIGHSMIKQFKSDRKELLKRFDDANQGIACLDQKKNCNKFQEIISLSPPLNLEEYENNDDPDMINSYKLLKANQCIDERSDSVNTYKNAAIDVASIGAGFLMGGVGGFVRLASVAGKVFVRGKRIKALSSAAVLGLEGAAIYNQSVDTIRSCRMARRNLTNFDKAETAVSCDGDDLQMTVTNQYNECLKDIAFLSVGAIAGIAPDIVKGFRGSSVALKAQPNNIERVTDIINQSGLEGKLDKNVIDTMLNLGIRGNEPTGIKKIPRDLQEWVGITPKALPKSNSEEMTMFVDLLQKYGDRIKAVPAGSAEATKLQKEIETTLVYFNQLSAKQQKLFLETFSGSQNLAKASSSSPVIKLRRARMQRSFKKAQENMRRLEEGTYHASLEKYLRQGLDQDEAYTRAADDALEARRATQERVYGCRANKVTEQHRRGAKVFTNFTVGFGLSSTAATFTMANNDRPKDFDFYKDLTYELSLAVILSKIGAKIQSAPSSTLAGRYGQATAVGAVVGGLDAAIFSSVYGISEEDVEDQIQRIQNNPDQLSALQKYDKYIEEEKIVERIENSLMAQFEHALTTPEMEGYFNQTEISIGGKTFSGPLNSVSLQDPELKAQIREAIIKEFYEDAKGVHGVGSVMADKYLYDRGYNALAGIPRNMIAGYMTYATLCRNADRPIRGLTQAMGIQAINQSVGGYLYYDLRKDYVGR